MGPWGGVGPGVWGWARCVCVNQIRPWWGPGGGNPAQGWGQHLGPGGGAPGHAWSGLHSTTAGIKNWSHPPAPTSQSLPRSRRYAGDMRFRRLFNAEQEQSPETRPMLLNGERRPSGCARALPRRAARILSRSNEEMRPNEALQGWCASFSPR